MIFQKKSRFYQEGTRPLLIFLLLWNNTTFPFFIERTGFCKILLWLNDASVTFERVELSFAFYPLEIRLKALPMALLLCSRYWTIKHCRFGWVLREQRLWTPVTKASALESFSLQTFPLAIYPSPVKDFRRRMIQFKWYRVIQFSWPSLSKDASFRE